VLSTLGLLSSDIKNDYVRTVLQRHNAFDLVTLNTVLNDLETQARRWLTEEGIAPPAQRLERHADLRYANQGYEITVPIPDGPLTAATLAQTLDTLHQEHQRLYTYASPELPVELVNLRVTAQGPAWPFTLRPLPATNGVTVPPAQKRAVYFAEAGGFIDCPVYPYATLPPGFQLVGPAILNQDLATIVIEPQHRMHLDQYGNIIVQLPQTT
jgi:N-methylhydantoinase A